ncbi:B12-binding domain-containing radical SAM protein [Clostridium sp. MSJ-11]|uniref:B12-binding domain-containing radical SAM protein n=1 Tax=Clostridium mobile TaxID=2841512 RepID=A0ABS6EKB3_9CLOT|nr:B12-binding domain-containing radical SAM protein [Clostridium mobile]MBU5484885.1 B12-binding domain-containing radical SAM protein [Clostridium mobile]
MKILLTAVNAKYIHSNLAVRYLKSFTEELPYNCEIKEFSINDNIERIVQNIIEEKPDIVGFSCYIWNIEFVERIATLIKLINKDIVILFGGPEVSYDPRYYLEKGYCDYLITGEGEETYKEFIEHIINQKSKEEALNLNINNVKGIYYKKDSFVFTGNRDLMDMDNIVFPYKPEDNLDNRIVYYEASRGCPFRCKYCLSSTIRGVRFLDINRVKNELKFFIDKKVRLVKFVDRTFNCNRKFAMEIWSFLISQDTETTFHFEISADILTKEEIELLSKSPTGRFQFEVGVQTTNDEVLKNINREINFKDIKEKVDELIKVKNIKQHLDLIVGLPGESYESFMKSFNDLYSIEPEEIQLGFLKLLKGSQMREEAPIWGMVYSPYPPYEILKNNHISYEEIIQLKRVEEMVDKYYNSGKFKTIIKYFIDKFKTPYDFYHSLGEFFYEKGYMSRNISSSDYYKVFLEFNSEILKNDNYDLKEIVKFDYLSFNKKRWLPDFLHREENKNFNKEIMKIAQDEGIIIKDKVNNYHIEKFNVDICQYIEKSILRRGDYYLLFCENNKYLYKNLNFLIEKYWR